MDSKNRLLSVENLSITHRGKRLLDAVSISIGFNEVLGVVGPSGSGKSLTAKALLNILPQGLICNRPFIDLRMGYVFQDPLSALNPLMSIGKQIEEVFIHVKGFLKKKAYEETLQLLEWIGFKESKIRFHQLPFQLSGGMRQRVVIAIALACDPQLLICDEATSALDYKTQKTILDLLERIKKEKGISILFITHDWTNVLDFCDRVLVMNQGQIVEEGIPHELYQNPMETITKSLIDACNL